MAGARVWCQVAIVAPSGSELARFSLSGPDNPDLGVVDRLARLCLLMGRHGGKVVLGQMCPELVQLLELAGLAELAATDSLTGPG